MTKNNQPKRRRTWLKGAVGLLLAKLPFKAIANTSEPATTLRTTPACNGKPSLPQTAGPFFSPDSPRRTNLLNYPEKSGQPLSLALKVVDKTCQPIESAMVEIWCCNTAGEYDNTGFHLRGHQLTNDDGLCQFELIQPGSYGNAWFRRTPHLHAKVTTAEGKSLTTQLYFPNHELNSVDGLYNPALELTIQRTKAQFVFVI